jgi:hypothetical protein
MNDLWDSMRGTLEPQAVDLACKQRVAGELPLLGNCLRGDEKKFVNLQERLPV